MRYRLRTLLIVLALGPVVLAGAWWGYGKWREEQEWRAFQRATQIRVDRGAAVRITPADPSTTAQSGIRWLIQLPPESPATDNRP